MAGYTGAFQRGFVKILVLMQRSSLLEDLPYSLFEINPSIKKLLLLLPLSS